MGNNNTLTPTIQNYLQSLPGIPWLNKGPVGQKWAQAVDFIDSQLVYQFVQAVQARFPEYMPVDAYGFMAAERQIIKGYNDGYNVSPSLDGYLYPQRMRAARNQWQYAGSALGILLQLHYQGVDAYFVQQNGLAYSLDTTIVSYNCFPPAIKLSCTTGGPLGSAVFSYLINGTTSGTITTTPGVFQFQLPGTQTILYFPQFNYVLGAEYFIDTNGFFTYSQGASPSIQQLTGPQNALIVADTDTDPNLNPPAPYVNFDTNSAMWSRFVIQVTPTPSWWTNIQIPATLSSQPSITTINILRDIINTWKSADSTCIGICVPVTSNTNVEWGWSVNPGIKWQTGGKKWGVPNPGQPAVYLFGMTDNGNQLDDGYGSTKI